MKKTVFAEAINGINPFFVEEALHYTAKSEKTRKAWSLVRIVAPIAACLAVALTVVFAVLPKKEIKPLPDTPVQADYSANLIASQTENASETQYEGDRIGNEFFIGPIAYADKQKPSWAFACHLGFRYWTFYPERTITIDCFMYQILAFSRHLANDEDYPDGYPFFEAYQYELKKEYVDLEDGMIYPEEIDGNLIVLNGCDGRFTKKYAHDDLYTLFAGPISDIFDGYCEELTLDFSNFEVGEVVSFLIRYGYSYSPDISLEKRIYLYAYIGEEGIVINPISSKWGIKEYELYEQNLRERKEITVESQKYLFVDFEKLNYNYYKYGENGVYFCE